MLVQAMRIVLPCVLCFLAIAVACNALATAPPARPKARVVGCERASQGTFREAIGSPGNQRIGPLLLMLAGTGSEGAARASVGELRRLGWWKMPALVEPGHTVTLAIASSRSRVSGWTYGPEPRPRARVPAHLRSTDQAITLRACGPRDVRHLSIVDGRRMTFWAGGIVFTDVPLCVPVEVWVDRETRPHRFTLSLAAG
ncbi:MAG: hypothetical protein M3Z95_01995, partial [Actinomycetota bacterium]|nr:hypothetical protein [Actinomycetota bacterium]